MPLVGGLQLAMHFEPARAIELLAREKVTMTSMPGSILGMVADMVQTKTDDLSALRTIIYGGAPTPMGVLHKAFATLPPALTHVYGITELSGFVTTLLPQDHAFDRPEKTVWRTASAGQAMPLVDVRVVDNEGRDAPFGEIGEIVCGGPKVMACYWRKPEQTAEVLRNGWYHTGDMGVLDAERFLTVVDRKKDMIISGGENVYSVEVESVISLHPDVAEVAVIGVPDERWGEAVKASCWLAPALRRTPRTSSPSAAARSPATRSRSPSISAASRCQKPGREKSPNGHFASPTGEMRTEKSKKELVDDQSPKRNRLSAPSMSEA